MRRFVIIDALALIHRAFHALPPLSDKKGRPVNALYGFSSVLLKMLKDLKPDFIAAAFDLAAPTFRDKIFASYKAQRPKTPEALTSQIPLVKEMLEAFNIKILQKEGFEADDIIGSLSKWLNKNYPDIECIIVTGDLDTLQLISDKTKVYTLKKGIGEIAMYGLKEVKQRYNLLPEQLTDYKGLVGDASDNIPGASGIGEKTAQKLLSRFKNLEGIYKNLDAKEISAKIKKILKEQKQEVFFSRDLATIHRDLPIREKLSDFAAQDYNKEKIINKILEFGFRSFLKRLPFDSADLPAARLSLQSQIQSYEKIPPLSIIKNSSSKETALFFRDNKEIFIAAVDNKSLIVANQKLAYKIAVDKIVDKNVDNEIIAYDAKNIFKLLLQSNLNIQLNFADKIFDIKIAAWLNNPDQKNLSLEKLCQKYELQSFTEKESPLKLNERIYFSFKLKEILKGSLQKNDLLKIYREIELPLIPILAKMELEGIGVSKQALAKLSQELNNEITNLEKEIYQLAGVKFNINSPKQLAPVLFEKLKLPTDQIIKTPKGALSTDETELKKLAGLHPIIEKILAFRELSKLKNTYTDVLPNYLDENSRVHTTFDQTGTATGRLSSLEPNLQNIPVRTDWGRRLRETFEARPGYRFVSFDFSQIELRLMAHFSKDPHLIAAFKEDKDIHAITAAKIHNLKENEVTPEQRRQAKTLNFGILYGLSSFGLSQATGMSRQEAKKFIKNYLAQFPGVKAYIEKAKKEASLKGYVETLFGRKRFLPALKNAGFRARLQAQREAVNAPLQGTVADLMKIAMIKTFKFLENYPKGSGFLLLQIHDDLLFEIKENLVMELAPKIKNIMENVFKLNVPLKVDVKVGINWGQMEDFKIDLF